MTPKPLSKEARAKMEWILAAPDRHLSMCFSPEELDYAASLTRELLAAEQYWREAVKKADHMVGLESDYARCAFCDTAIFSEPSDFVEIQGEKHKPDCPWVLAQ